MEIKPQDILSSLNQPIFGKKDILVARILSTSTSTSTQEASKDQMFASTVTSKIAIPEENINSSLPIKNHPRETEEDLHQTKRKKIELEEESNEEDSSAMETVDIPLIDATMAVREDNPDQESLEQYETESGSLHATDMYLDTVSSTISQTVSLY